MGNRGPFWGTLSPISPSLSESFCKAMELQKVLPLHCMPCNIMIPFDSPTPAPPFQAHWGSLIVWPTLNAPGFHA